LNAIEFAELIGDQIPDENHDFKMLRILQAKLTAVHKSISKR
jgi:hypothetical protein